MDSNETVLGKIGGLPVWIQEDQTPTCNCGTPMTFLALLEVCRMRLVRIRQLANYTDIQLIAASEPEDDEEED